MVDQGNRRTPIQSACVLCYVVALALALAAVASLYALEPDPAVVVSCLTMFCVAAVIAVLPAVQSYKYNAPVQFAESVAHLRRETMDLELVRQAHREVARELSRSASEVRELEQAITEAAERLRVFQDLHLEIQRLRQDTAATAAKLDGWADAAVLFLEASEAQHQRATELDENYVRGVQGQTRTFEKIFDRVGFSVVRPTSGDDFDELLHAAAEEHETDELPPGKVAECRAWGYKIGNHVLRRAEVVIARPAPVTDSEMATPATELDVPAAPEPESVEEGGAENDG